MSIISSFPSEKSDEAHTARTDNPHSVTAAQVGAYSKAEIDAVLSNKANKLDRGQASPTADLDTIFDIGTIAIHGTSSHLPPNFPAETWGILTVQKTGSGGFTQHLSQAVSPGYDAMYFERSYSGLGWSNWTIIATATQLPNRNLLDNGGMDIWQRGTSGTVSGVSYMADRWFDTHQAVQWERIENDGPAPCKYALKITSLVDDTWANCGQKFDPDLASVLAGKTVTASFWAKRFGNSDFGFNFVGSSPMRLSTNWTRLSATFTFPVDGAFGISTMPAEFYPEFPPVGVGNGYAVTGFKLELGNVATDFVPADYGTELAKCQRYQLEINPLRSEFASAGGGYAANATTAYIDIPTPTTMRIKPVVAKSGIWVLSNDSGASIKVATSITAEYFSSNCIMCAVLVDGGLEPGRYYKMYASGDTSARLLLDANL